MVSGAVLTNVSSTTLLRRTPPSVWPVTSQLVLNTPLAYAPLVSAPLATYMPALGPKVERWPTVGLRPAEAGQLITNVPDSLFCVRLAAGAERVALKVPVPSCAPFWPEQPEMVPVIVSCTAWAAFLRPGW